MRALHISVLVAVAVALSAAPSRADAPAMPATAATPAPTAPQGQDTVDLELGGSNDWLNAGRGMWHGSYALANFTSTSGFKAYAGALDTVRFGQDDSGYVVGIYVPTKTPHGTFNAEYGFSPQHNNLPATQWTAGYDLRLENGYGVQGSYDNRSYTTLDAQIWHAGFDKYFGDDRLAYSTSFAALSNVPGIAFSQTVSWSKTLPLDAVTVAANVGRDVENTGFNRIAVYDAASLTVDDVHWVDPHAAVHADVSYNSLAGAYQRFEVLLGLRLRF